MPKETVPLGVSSSRSYVILQIKRFNCADVVKICMFWVFKKKKKKQTERKNVVTSVVAAHQEERRAWDRWSWWRLALLKLGGD